MATSRNYPKAPITEAIIQLQVKPAAGLSLPDIGRVHQGEEKTYPQQKDIQVARGMIEIGERVSTAASAQYVGYMYTSVDQKQVYQAAFDFFSFSRLAPYESWGPFCQEARRLWGHYREHLKPAAVNRLAVRYINRLDIPGGRVDIRDYLRTQPEIAPDLPQELEGYFMHLQIPMADIKGRVVLNETIADSPKPGCVGLILDIDLFRTDDIPQDEEGIWKLFETLHVRKNDVFEACVTDTARELFS